MTFPKRSKHLNIFSYYTICESTAGNPNLRELVGWGWVCYTAPINLCDWYNKYESRICWIFVMAGQLIPFVHITCTSNVTSFLSPPPLPTFSPIPCSIYSSDNFIFVRPYQLSFLMLWSKQCLHVQLSQNIASPHILHNKFDVLLESVSACRPRLSCSYTVLNKLSLCFWVIPYQFTEVLHMTPSESDEIRCVGSPGGHMCPKGISPSLLVWLSRNGLLLFFYYFCCTCDHSKHHNLGTFHCFEKWVAPL